MRRDGKRTTADIVVERLIDWGVTTVFGLPGDGINGLMEALRQRKDRVRFVQVRHEESAAFMACAWAKYSGRLGVCMATSGPGAIHLLNGLYDARLDGAPVLAITGQTYHDLIGLHYQQEVDLLALFKDVAVYDQQIMGAGHAESLIDAACKAALTAHGVAHLTCAVDLQEQQLKEDEASRKKVAGHTSATWSPPVTVPCASDLEAAARLLNAGDRITILAGRGAMGAGEEVERLAERLSAPIVKPLLGKAVVPDDSPYTTGGIGLLGTLPSQEAMEQCDTLLMVGTNFPFLEFYPRHQQARGVQIDRDPSRLGLRFPIEIGLAGDARATLQALQPLLDGRPRPFLKETQERMQHWRELMRDRGTRPDLPMKPQVVAHHLGELLDDNAIISTDSGTSTIWVAQHVQLRRGQLFAVSGNLASMACGLPYAIAAQLAYPDRQAVAVIGDGGFSMLMAELATAVKYELPITVIVMKNDSLGMIKWEQMVFLGNPEYGCELQPIDFVKFAEACGAVGMRCDNPASARETLSDALDVARERRGPVLVEAVIDPLEPPHPPRVTAEQALHMARALARGEPDRGRIVRTLIRDKVHDVT